MFYTIRHDILLELVKEELSKVADEAYGEDGTSLYDVVTVTSKDEGQIAGFVDDAARALVRHADDIARFEQSPVDTDTGLSYPGIRFNVPDLDPTQTPDIASELHRYIVMSASTALLQSRRAALVPEYANRVQAALDNVITMLRTRVTPTR